MQPRALGRRVSDEFPVPLCRTHHRALHRSGDEGAWWKSTDLDPVMIAQRLWQHSRLNGAPIQQHIEPWLGAPSQPNMDDGRANLSTTPGDQYTTDQGRIGLAAASEEMITKPHPSTPVEPKAPDRTSQADTPIGPAR
jgi:hypothetical protein